MRGGRHLCDMRWLGSVLGPQPPRRPHTFAEQAPPPSREGETTSDRHLQLLSEGWYDLCVLVGL